MLLPKILVGKKKKKIEYILIFIFF